MYKMNWYDNLLNDTIDKNEEFAFKIAYDFASYLDKRQINYIEFAKEINTNVKEIKSILVGNLIPNNQLLENIELKSNTKIFQYLSKEDNIFNIPFVNTVFKQSNIAMYFPKIQSGSLQILPNMQSSKMNIEIIGIIKSRPEINYLLTSNKFERSYVR